MKVYGLSQILGSFSGHLRRSLLVWFIVISTLPFAWMAYLTLSESTSHLSKLANEKLSKTVALHSNHFKSLVANYRKDLEYIATSKATGESLTEFSNRFETFDGPVSDFFKSYSWELAYQQTSNALNHFRDNRQLSDLLLIDLSGNVMFSDRDSRYRDVSIFSDDFASGRISAAAKRAVELEMPTFSGFELGVDGEIEAFLFELVRDQYGNKAGLIGLPVPYEEIVALLEVSVALGDVGTSYLIDVEGRVVASSDSTTTLALSQFIETSLVNIWQSMIAAGQSEMTNLQLETDYIGINGTQVQGIGNALKIADLPFLMVSEISSDKVLAPITVLKNTVLWVGLATLFAVITLAIVLSSNIIKPLVSSMDTISSSTNELEQMTSDQVTLAESHLASINEVVVTVEELNRSAQLSNGQLSTLSSSASSNVGLINKGTQALKASEQEIESLQVGINQIVESSKALTEVSAQIRSMTDNVNALGDQIRLLSINASIVAATSGEEGQSFAIIAKEIGQLMHKTQQFIDEISALSNSTDALVESSVHAANDGSEAVSRNVALADEISLLFSKLSQSYSVTVEGLQQVKNMIQEQSSAVNQISQAVRSISDDEAGTLRGASRAKESIDELYDVVQSLKRIVK